LVGVTTGVVTGAFAGVGVPAQPIAAAASEAKSSRESSVFERRGIPKRSSAAMASPPPRGKLRRSGSWTTALDTGVVLTVSVAVTGAVPEIAAGAVTEQVGISAAPAGLPVTAQVTATVPVKPLLGVIVRVEVPLAPGEAMLTAVLLKVKFGCGRIVTMTFVVFVMPPDVAVTVTG
jgi:hypothetical protein